MGGNYRLKLDVTLRKKTQNESVQKGTWISEEFRQEHAHTHI